MVFPSCRHRLWGDPIWSFPPVGSVCEVTLLWSFPPLKGLLLMVSLKGPHWKVSWWKVCCLCWHQTESKHFLKTCHNTRFFGRREGEKLLHLGAVFESVFLTQMSDVWRCSAVFWWNDLTLGKLLFQTSMILVLKAKLYRWNWFYLVSAGFNQPSWFCFLKEEGRLFRRGIGWRHCWRKKEVYFGGALVGGVVEGRRKAI